MLSVLFRVLEAGGGAAGEAGLESEFCLVEKWRRIERPLAPAARVLRVWLAWGEDKSEVRLVVKRAAAAVPAAACRVTQIVNTSKTYRNDETSK